MCHEKNSTCIYLKMKPLWEGRSVLPTRKRATLGRCQNNKVLFRFGPRTMACRSKHTKCTMNRVASWHSICYGVASVSRIDKNIGLFCKRDLYERLYSAKETYDLIDPTNRSHPIYTFISAYYSIYYTHCGFGPYIMACTSKHAMCVVIWVASWHSMEQTHSRQFATHIPDSAFLNHGV